MGTVALRGPYLTVFALRSLPARLLISRLGFFLLLLVLGFSSTVCLVKALSVVDRPFPGFLVNERMVLAYLGPPYWSGVQAGLKFPDKVLRVDGVALSSTHDLDQFIERAAPGEIVRYTVERKGRVQDVSVKVMQFSWLDLIITFGAPFLIGMVYVLLGAIVFTLKPDTSTSWVFIAACALLSISTTISFDYISTHSGSTLIYLLIVPYLAAAVLHLGLVFPEPFPWITSKPALAVAPYIVSTALAIPLVMLYPEPRFLRIYTVVLVYLVASTLALLLSAALTYFRHASVLAQARARVVLWGAALGLPMAASVPILSSFGITLGNLPTTLAAIPLLIFPASIGYAIARHNLFDVDVYLKRTVGYAIMTVVVAMGYFSMELLGNSFLIRPVFGESADKVFPIIFALLVVFCFQPIHRRVQDRIDKLFFRKQYDYKSTIASVSDALTSLMDLEGFLGKVIRRLRDDMFLDRAGIILLDDRRQSCEAMFSDDGSVAMGRLGKDPCLHYGDPLLELLARERRLITKYDIAEDPRFAASRQACGQRFSELGASLALPLFYRDQFTGVLTLGHKKSGHFYTREDVELLQTLSSMTSTAIEQSREKLQRETLMRMFSTAVSPEVAEALWQEREQFLDGGRPKSQKLMVTVMFTDLEGFSSMSEQYDPEILMGWLNTYMEAITKIVMVHRGVVDDYFGDGVKANFGVPLPRTTEDEIREDATNAVRCALGLEREMNRLNAIMKDRELPTLRMRIGINTGPVVAGSVGSEDRMKYTTLGDTVNTSARLEQFSKDLALPAEVSKACRILISESTWKYVASQFKTERVGELSLKGKDQKIPTYCVLDEISPPAIIIMPQKEATHAS